MKRLFALGGIVMLLLCFTVPAQATEFTGHISFEDYAEGEIWSDEYLDQYVMNFLGMMVETIFPLLTNTAPQHAPSGSDRYRVDASAGDMYLGIYGSKPPDSEELPDWIPNDKAAGIIMMFYGPLKYLSVDYAKAYKPKLLPGWNVHAGSDLDVAVFPGDSMMEPEDPFYEHTYTMPTAVETGNWDTIELFESDLQGGRMAYFMAPTGDLETASMAFDEIHFTLGCIPAWTDTDSDVDGVDFATVAAEYDSENRDDDDLGCLAHDFGFPNMEDTGGPPM